MISQTRIFSIAATAVFTLMFATNVLAASSLFEGKLEIVVEDYQDGRHKVRNFLKRGKQMLEIKASISSKLKTDDKIRVRGNLKKENNKDVLELDQNGSSSAIELVEAAVFPNTFGDQRVAVLMVNFQDNITEPFTLAAAQSAVFGTTNNFYKENSFQQTSLSGDVMGYFTIAASSTVCDAYDLAAKADAAAVSAGYNLNNYSRKIYVFPRLSSCGWAGLGNVGGSVTRAWLNGSMSLLVVAHELGHNFGLRHAHALNCTGGVLASSCTQLPYGDVADTMGNIRAGHFNPFEKELLGWLNSPSMPSIITAATNGRYVIEPYAAQSFGSKAIKIPRGGSDYYYVEFRQPIGVDSVLTSGNLAQGVMVRSAIAGNADSSYLLDMTPDTSTSTNTEFNDGALGVGRTYYDSVARVGITLVSISPSGATVDVVYGSAPVTTTTLPPATTTTLPPATTTTTLPPATTTTLPPATTTTTLPPVTTTTLPPATTTTTLPPVTTTTLPADTQAPVAAILSPASGSSVKVRSVVAITAQASDNVGLNRVDFYVNNSLVCSDASAPYSCSWKVPGKTGKSHSIEARAIDRSGNIGRAFVNVLAVK